MWLGRGTKILKTFWKNNNEVGDSHYTILRLTILLQ